MALRRLRSWKLPTVLWIDALCIDQQNPVERGHQVWQMQAIFANASAVYAYIGEGDPRSDALLNVLNTCETPRNWPGPYWTVYCFICLKTPIIVLLHF
jgi:hypothetical protein